MNIHNKLHSLGLALPQAAAAVADYVPATLSGNHIYVSGQLPFDHGKLIAEGKVPNPVSQEQACHASQQCALNAIAAVDHVIDGDWSRFRRIVRVAVYVNSEATFTEQHLVANGASELLGKIFGDAGRHVRAAVGVAALPLNAAVEVELQVEIT